MLSVKSLKQGLIGAVSATLLGFGYTQIPNCPTGFCPLAAQSGETGPWIFLGACAAIGLALGLADSVSNHPQ